MEVVIIENERLIVTVAPMLGGRIIGLRDKIANFDLIDSRELNLTSGVGFVIDREPFNVATDPCSYQIMEAEEEVDQAGVILFGSNNSSSLSWQVAIALKPNSHLVELKFQIVCRSYGGALENNGIWFAGTPTTSARALGPDRYVSYDSARRSALFVQTSPGVFEYSTLDEAGASVLRMSPAIAYGSRQLDSWSASLGGYAGLSGQTFSNDRVAFHLDDSEIEFISMDDVSNGKLALLSSNGESVEAPISAYAGRREVIQLPSTKEAIEGIAFIAGGGAPLLKWEKANQIQERFNARGQPKDKDGKPRKPELDGVMSFGIMAIGQDPTGMVEMELKLPARKRPALEVLGDYAMTQNDFSAALDHYDRALAYGAEDAILWWKKAYAMRKAGLETEERDELANAHFLSPLEPLLRAEAFLSQPVSSEKAPNPLVAPLALFPDQMTLVANHLLEIGQLQDAARWIDECLRHREIPMLRILWAAMLLANGAKAEAYAQAKLGSGSVVEPMRSRRWKETAALDALNEAFPELPNLKAEPKESH